ncbi:hypothetical protein BCR32DRAFT_285081 [Anaeromyces robustus]|uniref:Uncharacterized protein n=1 Tax=Anaeromyces robustus TaxID=1754192 RepID=A0A1Y1WPU8_9FUNG|nr:hypothetical protein BCR32DRAFT_285081 [Anaeromyces robustus]|eukprot:ORX75561.1 hypothetical protein BCR32DRAFT_285081 [Anaeromyces robustus]
MKIINILTAIALGSTIYAFPLVEAEDKLEPKNKLQSKNKFANINDEVEANLVARSPYRIRSAKKKTTITKKTRSFDEEVNLERRRKGPKRNLERRRKGPKRNLERRRKGPKRGIEENGFILKRRAWRHSPDDQNIDFEIRDDKRHLMTRAKLSMKKY